MHAPPLSAGGKGVEPTKFSKKGEGGLDRTSALKGGGRGLARKRGGGVFEGGGLIPRCTLCI